MERPTHLTKYDKLREMVINNMLSNANKLSLKQNIRTKDVRVQNKTMYEYEENKMAYDANKAELLETKTQLPPDTIQDGLIIQIDDGKVKDFIPESSHNSWKGDLEQTAINLMINVKCDELIELKQMFTYIYEDNKTKFTSKSNLGKFYEKYKELPRVGLKVKIAVNKDGLGKIKLD